MAYLAIGFSRDGKGVYVATDKDGEFLRIAYMDVATGAMKYLNNDPWDVEDAALSENRELLAYVRQRKRAEHAACTRPESR